VTKEKSKMKDLQQQPKLEYKACQNNGNLEFTRYENKTGVQTPPVLSVARDDGPGIESRTYVTHNENCEMY
jgi:hypothetical protein